ncbi:MAG: PQQ-binding-like beta-propeller repeat protein [Gemmataceae bacterium]|nr:PQQ-binding-like beta-propeller repeat protein [Gemmataceae bacterium]
MRAPIVRIMAALLVLAVGVMTTAQVPRSRIFSRPESPSDDVLRRLNMTLAWRQAVPMEGPKDRFLAIQLDHRDVFVLTRSGMVARLDGATGRILWKTRVGKAYAATPSLAFNSHGVYVVANADLYGLSRATGNVDWEQSLPSGPGSSLVADEDQVYVPLSTGTMAVYIVPGGRIHKEIEATRGSTGKPRPRDAWSEYTNLELAFSPVLTEDSVLLMSPSGKGRGYAAYMREGVRSNALYQFEAEGKVGARPGQFDDRGYVASDDGNMYAIGIFDGKLAWRYVAGSQITRTPAGFADDVYVTSRREGMARLDPETGRALWAVPVGGGKRLSVTNPSADLFLARSAQYVYARDFAGRVLVIDRKRGTTLSMVDWTAFRFPVPNTWTDRLFLAANDGTLLCLHDREQRSPILHQRRVNERRVLNQLRVRVLEKKLPKATLKKLLDPLMERYNLRVAEMPKDIAEKEAELLGVDNRRLWDLLVKLLEPLDLGFKVDDDAIVIVPKKDQEPDPDAKAAPPPKEPPPKEPKDKGKDKDPDKEKEKEKDKEKERRKDKDKMKDD